MEVIEVTKPFLTYEQQIEKLKNEKHLIIKDEVFAAEKLKELGYFTLIGGYKEPFRNKMTRVYVNDTTFEDVYTLYQFDNELRELIFKYLCQIEKKMRSLLSYAFCEQHGEMQRAYLDSDNYNYSKKNQRGVNKLIQILDRLANQNTDYAYLVYQRRVYKNVPLWVLTNAMTFGQLSKMYSFLPSKIQGRISQNFTHVNERELEQYMKVLVLYRNVCAHNERLFSHKVYSEIPNTILHQKLHIPQNGTQYVLGKKDLFAIVIAFRYLVPKDDFISFKRELVRKIETYVNKSQRISETQLLASMGFPENWKTITRYKI
jgi:abortive infection bacteriophage resistance protein